MNAYWTRARIVEALTFEADRLGRPPKQIEWKNATPDHPSRTTVADMFGSWNNALRSAGLPTRKQGMPARWGRESIGQAIYHAAFKLKRVPTSEDMKRLSQLYPDEFPSTNTIRYHLGSWNEGLIAVGYRPHKVTRRRRAPQHCPRCDSQHWGFQACESVAA